MTKKYQKITVLLVGILSLGSGIEVRASDANPADGVIVIDNDTVVKRMDVAKDGIANLRVLEIPQGTIAVTRREEPAIAEMHERVSHMLIAKEGSGVILLGGRLEGSKLTEPGEWREGRIVGGRDVMFKPGDLVWIPAGVPHQLRPTEGSTITYYAVRYLLAEAQ